MHRAGPLVLLFIFTVSLPAAGATAAAMTYIHHAPESPLDVRYEYHWEILRTALEVTTRSSPSR
jgi:hypothetical protein